MCAEEGQEREEESGAASGGLWGIGSGTHAPVPLLRVLRNALDGRRLAECRSPARTCVCLLSFRGRQRMESDGNYKPDCHLCYAFALGAWLCDVDRIAFVMGGTYLLSVFVVPPGEEGFPNKRALP